MIPEYYAHELYHYGTKGMKWGVRRFQNEDGSLKSAGKKRYSEMTTDVNDKKAAYKQAKKDFNKSYNKAYNKSIAALSPSKKHRQANDKRWDDAFEKADRLDKAKTEYKNAKNNEKLAIRDKTRELQKKASLGEKLTYNTATRKQAAKYIVKNNMTVEEATKKAKGEAWRNSAAFLAVYGGVMAAVVYKANH